MHVAVFSEVRFGIPAALRVKVIEGMKLTGLDVLGHGHDSKIPADFQLFRNYESADKGMVTTPFVQAETEAT